MIKPDNKLKCTCGMCRTCKAREAWRKKNGVSRQRKEPVGKYVFHSLPIKVHGLNGAYTWRELKKLFASDCVPVDAVVEGEDGTFYRIARRQRLVLVQVAA